MGAIEELSSPSSQSLVRDQFETIYFGQVNFIKATIPTLREKHTGHIVVLTGITGHIGTPGMPMYSASTWALEGYCDSLAYEIAPFNIKLTIVQPNKEVQLLANKITFSPQMPEYDSKNNPVPGLRDILMDVANNDPETRMCNSKGKSEQGATAVSIFPRIPPESLDRLVLETVYALTAIGGHENPPSRHIVGFEGVIAVKEKLKTVTEELEDFVEVSCGVDIFKTDLGAAALAKAGKVDVGDAGVRGGSSD